MGKPRPTILHVNSFGKKRGLFQDLMHSEEGYYFYPLDGKQKTLLFIKGKLDGEKRDIKLFSSFSECLTEVVTDVLVFHAQDLNVSERKNLIGNVSLDISFLIQVKEAEMFLQTYCYECEAYGESGCAKMMEYFCADEDRERYRDTPWFYKQKEYRLQRKEKRNVKKSTMPV